MKSVVAVVLMVAWPPSLDAQVTALLNKLPDASTELRLRNDCRSNSRFSQTT